MSNLIDQKRRARKDAMLRRDKADPNVEIKAIELLSLLLEKYRGNSIAGYLAIKNEINPLRAMEEASKHGLVGIPVIGSKGSALKFSKWSPDCRLKEGRFGAKVPIKNDFFEPEILIVPLLAFDKAGGRVGYGGGYYDRTLEFLRAKRRTLAIGFAYSLQMANDLPIEKTDQHLDFIVTEKEIITI